MSYMVGFLWYLGGVTFFSSLISICYMHQNGWNPITPNQMHWSMMGGLFWPVLLISIFCIGIPVVFLQWLITGEFEIKESSLWE